MENRVLQLNTDFFILRSKKKTEYKQLIVILSSKNRNSSEWTSQNSIWNIIF